MPKTKQQKQESVAWLIASLKSAKGVVFANFQGLTVAQSEELRNTCRKEQVEVLATKKTLLQRALDEVGLGSVAATEFKGGIAAFMGADDEIAPAKIVNTFAKKHDIVTLFGGILEGKFIDAGMVKSLAAIPSKQELLAKLVGSLNAPVAGFVNVLAGNLRNFVGVLSNIQKAKV